VFGSAGFPDLLCTGTGSGGLGDCFASEKAADSGELGDGTVTLQPWRQEQGGTLLVDPTTSDITRYGLAFTGPGMNVGGNTTAVITGLSCLDTGLDPKEPGSPADSLTDCLDSSVAWSTEGVFPNDAGGTPGGLKRNAGIDNLVLFLSTDAAGNIVQADAYYTMEYSIISAGDNSMVGGTLNLTGTRSPCVAGADPLRVIDDGTAQNLDVLANDGCEVPPETIVTGAGDFAPDKLGTASTDGATVTYTPAGGGAADSPEVFTYTVEDGFPNQDQGTVTITLFDDLIPAPTNLVAETQLNISVAIDVTAGGTNPLGNIEQDVTNPPGNPEVTQTAPDPTLGGTVQIFGLQIIYTPPPSIRGDDTFGYTITDSNGDSASAEITVTIGARPKAPDFMVADKIDIGSSEDIDIALIPDVVLGDPPSTITATDGANGTTSVAGTVVTYAHPAGGVCGDDSFTYTIEDVDLETATGTIFLTVNCVVIANDAAAPGIDTTGVMPESQSSSIDVLAIAGNDPGDDPTAVAVTDGASGTTSLDVNTNIVTYTPNSDFFTGNDSYTYTLTDVDGDTDTGTITVALTAAAPTAGNLSADTEPGIPVDIDVTGSVTVGSGTIDQHEIAVTSGPSNGTAVFNGLVVTYTPNPGSSGADSFEYTVKDGGGDTATGTITVTVIDLTPIAGNISAETVSDVAVKIDVTGSVTLGNGSIDEHEFTVTSNPSQGTAAFNGPVVTYTPNSESSGTDSFEYTVTDRDGSSDSGTITVDVAQGKVQDELPGGSNALGSELAVLLILLPWLRRRRVT
jgi:hypothetical protein